MIARSLLPRFGGSAAVWTSSLVFFQLLLFLGYAFADHLVRRSAHPRRLYGLCLLCSLIALPIGTAQFSAGAAPTLAVLAALALGVGAPYFILSTTAPMVQASIVQHSGSDSYVLYAWSNLGSLFGLLGYPLLIEPHWSVPKQLWAWSGVYVLFLFGLWRLTAVLKPGNRSESTLKVVAPGSERYAWFSRACVGVALLVSISGAVMKDLTVSPILWVVPLAVYLLTFIFCFGRPKWGQHPIWWPIWLGAIALVAYLSLSAWSVHWSLQLSLWSIVLGTGCILCHSDLVERQPDPVLLTQYYFHIAAGGMVGGLLVGVMAPAIFNVPMETEFCVLATSWIGWQQFSRRRRAQSPFAPLTVSKALSGLVVLSALVVFGIQGWKTIRGDTVLYRSFYGNLQVKRYEIPRKKGGIIHLLDGRISHGFQYGSPKERRRPTTYFVPGSGVGRVLSKAGPPKRVGILGLGVGTLASYAREGDRFQFYELNPQVIQIAKQHFTYLSDAKGVVTTIVGDGRLELEKQADQGFDVLIVDAFTGDAIPAHLLTREAFLLYLRHLKPNGILAINISNRHAALIRVVGAHARRLKYAMGRVRYRGKSPLGVYLSEWVLLARTAGELHGFELKTQVIPEEGIHWTDDYAPLLPILK